VTRPVLAIKDDGTLLLKALTIQIPDYWKATDTPGIYACQLPPCKYRRFSYQIKGGQLVARLHCFLQRRDCTPEECQSCLLANPDFGVKRKVSMETDNGDGTQTVDTAVVRVANTDPNLLARLKEPWVVPRKGAKPIARPDLQSIQDTLPPRKPGRDRTFRIEEDGVIVYEKEEGDWEPPRDINGYERDPDDPWRFIPLWPPCAMRHQIGVRYASCGCIGIVMRCSHPEHPKHMDRVGHEDCQACPFRKSEK